ncbi:MAG: hypothetical protein QM791_22565 [Ferruginibacter sp.]
MKTNLQLLIVFFAGLFFCSCYSARYVYSPAAHNVPVLTEKGDNKVALLYSSNWVNSTYQAEPKVRNRGRGLDAQGAYAFTDHFAVQGAYVYRSEMNFADKNYYKDSSTLKYNRHMAELGLGYYMALGKRGNTLFQVFAGGGYGKSVLSDLYMGAGDTANRFFNMNVSKLYIQPAFTFRFSDNFNISLSNRLSFVYFSNVSTNYDASEINAYKLAGIGSKKIVFYEPAFINGFRFDKLRGIQFEIQFGFSGITGEHYADHRAFNFAAGVCADITEIFGGNTRRQKN